MSNELKRARRDLLQTAKKFTKACEAYEKVSHFPITDPMASKAYDRLYDADIELRASAIWYAQECRGAASV